LFTAARISEQVRSGIQALPRGQRMAGYAMGLTQAQTYRFVLLPVAYRIVIPPMTSELMNLIKNTAVAFSIGLVELFFRTREKAEPIISDRHRVPKAFPPHPRLDESQLTADIAKAAVFRPEIRRIELLVQKVEIDRKLAKNHLLPNLDLGVEAGQFLGGNRPRDIERNEVEAKMEFKLPLQRREALGRVDIAEATIVRLNNDKRFARDRITADVRDAYSALIAAYDALKMTRVNVELAHQLEAAENERLKQGATDLLALQIREQATFDGQVLEVEAQADYFRAQANYRAAIAADAPSKLTR
jgi:outer membrane protein TolC